MLELMKQLRMTIPNEHTFAIEFNENSIWFKLYEVEVPIVYENGNIFIETEVYNYRLYSDMVEEIDIVMKFIKSKKSLLDEILQVGDAE